MTPLAYRIIKRRWAPPDDREVFKDEGGLLKQMDDIHCFEVSEVFELLDDLGRKWHQDAIGPNGRYKGEFSCDTTLAFQPAPKTWIEWRGLPEDGKGYRMGVLLEEGEGASRGLSLLTVADYHEQTWEFRPFLRTFPAMVLPLRERQQFGDLGFRYHDKSGIARDMQMTLFHRLYAALALINSPKVIGRRQFMPHKTLIKRFAVGKFPLHAWTEIRLEVGKPPEIDDGFVHEARLTGQRALHFCRKHVRIKMGRLEYVRSHWRGDAAIGIKRSRYSVVPAPAQRR